MKNTRVLPIDIPKQVTDTYCVGDYGFPSEDVNPQIKKGADWCRQFTRAVLQQHFLGLTVLPYANQGRMMDIRAYFNGKQSVDRYYPRLFGPKLVEDQNKLNARLGTYRSTWKIMSLAPQIGSYIKSKLDEVDFDVQATSINPLVNDMKEEKEFRMLANGMIPKETFAMMEASGIKIPEETIISNLDEMNLFKEIGGLKPAEELVAQMLIDYTFKNTDWPYIHNLLSEDVICFNKALTKDVIDVFSGKVGVEYVDPVNFVGLIDNRSSESDFAYAGQIKMMSIKTIRAMLRQQGRYNESVEGMLKATSIMYMQFYNNRSIYNENTPEYSSPRNGLYAYDLFHVPVIDLEYKSVDLEKRRFRTNSKGETKYLRCDFEEQGEDIVITSKEYFYKSVMVLGSELMVDYGRASDQQRVGLTKVRSSYHMVSSPNPSIIERIIPILDDMAFDYIKYQNDSARALPNTIAISKSALRGNRQDGNNLTEGEALEMMMSSGKILYEDLQIVGNSVMNTAVPIKEIAGGMGKVLEEYVTKVNMNLMLLREVLNIRQSEAAPRVAVQVAQLVENQSDRSISDILSLMKRLRETTAEGCYKRIKLSVAYNKEIYDGYYPIVGKTSLDCIKLTADISAADMGFVFIQKPRDFEVQDDLNRLAKLSEPTASGLPPIEMSTYFVIRDAILSGRTKVAQAYMLKAEAKRIEIGQKLAERNAMMQNQIIQQQLQMKAQQEQARIWAEAQAQNWLAEQEFKREMQKEINFLSSPAQTQNNNAA